MISRILPIEDCGRLEFLLNKIFGQQLESRVYETTQERGNSCLGYRPPALEHALTLDSPAQSFLLPLHDRDMDNVLTRFKSFSVHSAAIFEVRRDLRCHTAANARPTDFTEAASHHHLID